MNDDLFERIAGFTRQELAIRKKKQLSRSTKLGKDLGVVGLDGNEFINAFAEEFSVDFQYFEFNRNFDTEVFDPLGFGWLIYWIIHRRSMSELNPTYDPTLGDLERAVEMGRWEQPKESNID